MAGHALTQPQHAALPRPALTMAGKAAVALLALLGVGAVAGGVALVMEPDGSVMQFSTALLAGSPFTDYFVPGLILGGLFGVGSFAVAILGLRHQPLAPFLAFAIGCAQMIWIVVELAIIRELSFLHPVCFALGLGIAAASVSWGWPSLKAWRAGR
ncbi:MAG TPA: hypothetical protein VMH24_09175 [Candidatus Sulfotelmatobacter sp.]|nr:hypothetical protein [Candidatus Sulfotelmatobacter sp.]